MSRRERPVRFNGGPILEKLEQLEQLARPDVEGYCKARDDLNGIQHTNKYPQVQIAHVEKTTRCCTS